MENRIIMIKTNGKLCDGQCKFIQTESIYLPQRSNCNLFKKKLKRLPNANIQLNLFYRCKLCLNATGIDNANKGISQTI